MSDKKEFWGIIELFGHQKIAGYISEEQMGGAALVRCDVPAVDGSAAFTRMFGNGAIYSISPTSEELVRVFISRFRPAPLNVYMPEIKQLEPSDPEEEEGPY